MTTPRSARKVLADAIVEGYKAFQGSKRSALPYPLLSFVQAEAVIDAIEGMSHDELRELRPDIAILFDATRHTSDARRAAYILALTTRAHTTTGRPVTIHLTIQDDDEDQT